jgi:hypothetical protein
MPVFLKLSAIVDHFIGGRPHADHLRNIPHTHKCVQVNRSNIKSVVLVTIATFFLHTDLSVL